MPGIAVWVAKAGALDDNGPQRVLTAVTPPGARSAGAMSEAKFIDVDGIRTRYFMTGEGAPLVLFHGGNFGSRNLTESACDWELNIQGLSQWYRVFAVDKLGQGYTDNPKDDDYSMAAVVRHAHGFLAALGLEDVHVVGHSRGGYLVCRLTLDHPERIRSCVIVDSNTLAPGIPRSEIVLANPPRAQIESREPALDNRALLVWDRPHHRILARRGLRRRRPAEESGGAGENGSRGTWILMLHAQARPGQGGHLRPAYAIRACAARRR